MELSKKVLNEEGLHARPAGVLAKTASGYQSKIDLIFNGRTVNAKSSMSLMTLGLSHNSEVQLRVEGPDAAVAMQKLSDLFDNKFQV